MTLAFPKGWPRFASVAAAVAGLALLAAATGW